MLESVASVLVMKTVIKSNTVPGRSSLIVKKSTAFSISFIT